MIPLRGVGPLAMRSRPIALVVSIATGLAVANAYVVLRAFVHAKGSLIEEGISALAIAILSTLVFRRLLSAKPAGRRREPSFNTPLSRCILFGVLGGMLAGVVAKTVNTVFGIATSTANLRELKTLALATALWIGAGAIIGLLFGAAFHPFTKLASGRIARGSADAFDGALVASSGLAAVVGLGAASCTFGVSTSVLVVSVTSVTTVGLAAIGLAVAAVWDFRRARWIVRVADGKVAGWSINPNEKRLVLGSYVDGVVACDAVVTFAPHETEVEQGSPFRSAEVSPSAVALVDQTGRLSARRAFIRAMAAVTSIFLFIIIGPAAVSMAREMMFAAAYSSIATQGQPMPMFGLDGDDVNAISMDEGSACARHANGKLSCWGWFAGVLRNDGDYVSDTAEPVKAIGPVLGFAVGQGWICAVPEGDAQHRAVCWGRNFNGELGDGTKSPHRGPRPVGPPDVVELAQGSSFTIARTKDGHVWQWGNNPYELRDEPDTSTEPHIMEGVVDAVQIAASREHACALDRAGAVSCWGHDSSGQLGRKDSDTNKQYMQPARVEGLPPIDRIVLGGDASAAHRKRDDGRHEWWSWGRRLPWGTREHKMSAHPDGWGDVDRIPNTEEMRDVQIGWDAACGLFDDRSVRCWGEGALGRLGDGNMAIGEHETSTPMRSGALAIAGEQYHTCARRADDVVCWGKR